MAGSMLKLTTVNSLVDSEDSINNCPGEFLQISNINIIKKLRILLVLCNFVPNISSHI